jgi:MFS family permease
MSAREEPIRFVDEVRAGWRAGLGSILGMACGASLFFPTSGLYVRPLSVAFHWSRGQIALGALATLLGAISAPAAGAISDRFGARIVGTSGLVCMAGAFLGLANMNGEIVIYYLWMATIATLGAAGSAIVLLRPLVHAFDRFRGAALGFGLALSALLVALILPADQAVISAWGWRAGYLFLAGLSGIAGPLAVLWLLPAHWGVPLAAGKRMPVEGETLTDAVRDRRFWLIFIAMLTANLCFGGLLGQLPAMLTDRGISPMQAGLVLSCLTASAVVGRLLSGVAMDRLWVPGVAGATLLIPVGGLMLLLVRPATLPTAFVAAALLGMAQGGEAAILSYFIARYFGFRSYGAIYGALSIGTSLSLAGGGVMFGLAYDWTHSYDGAILVAAGGLMIAATSLTATGLTLRHRTRPA